MYCSNCTLSLLSTYFSFSNISNRNSRTWPPYPVLHTTPPPPPLPALYLSLTRHLLQSFGKKALPNLELCALCIVKLPTLHTHRHLKKKLKNLFALNWPKLAWYKDKWNVYTMYAVQLICTNFVLILSVLCSSKGMYFWYIWQTYSTGITKKELTNVEIQEQTASFTFF